jgi:predicted enzyme related to lactoylglutathione lyase
MEEPALQSVAHFAINADDVEASRAFYAAVFDWRFEAWGPPDFFKILTADGHQPGPIGALQRRRDLAAGMPTTGFECTVAVDDVDAVLDAVRSHGGMVLMEKTTITGVGDLVFFADPSGNVCGAMRYHSDAD